MQQVIIREELSPVIADIIVEDRISYYYGNDITFILTDKKTIVHTSLQTFLVKHDHRNYLKRLERLREMIINDEMKSLAELISYCGYRPGNYHDQMCGLEMVPTRLERHL